MNHNAVVGYSNFMTTINTYSSFSDHQANTNFLKMAKRKSVMFTVMVIVACALILVLTEANPVGETLPEAVDLGETTRRPNGSRLVISHVIKTIEFEVDVEDDDSNSTEYDNTETTPYEETDIKLLDINLLRDLLARSSAIVNNTQEP